MSRNLAAILDFPLRLADKRAGPVLSLTTAPPGRQYKLRSQTFLEKIDQFKMNRAKARLDGMLKEYGQRGKLKAESLRLRMDLKAAGEEIKGLTERRDRLQLEIERRAAAGGPAPDSCKKADSAAAPSEEARARRDSGAKRRSGASAEEDEGRDAQDALIELNEAIEEQETKSDYHRERLAEVRRLAPSLRWGSSGTHARVALIL